MPQWFCNLRSLHHNRLINEYIYIYIFLIKIKILFRERERMVDSSGTEGDSSQNSQRSVVYLHATTVGAIPQPHVLHTRRAKSREELSSLKSSSIVSPSSQQSSKAKQLQPMTRTVSRSLSVLAPWTPKHIHDGYEINYSQQNNKKDHQVCLLLIENRLKNV